MKVVIPVPRKVPISSLRSGDCYLSPDSVRMVCRMEVTGRLYILELATGKLFELLNGDAMVQPVTVTAHVEADYVQSIQTPTA